MHISIHIYIYIYIYVLEGKKYSRLFISFIVLAYLRDTMFVFSNAYCTGTFKATDTSKSVQITFLDFDLSYCCDYVEIFDGMYSWARSIQLFG